MRQQASLGGHENIKIYLD